MFTKPSLKEPKTIQEWLIYATWQLQSASIESPNFEARILIQHATGKLFEYLLARFEEELPINDQLIFNELVNRRLSLEPIAYIIGLKEFYGYEFIVNNKVLIPRDDTEIIVEAILKNNNPESCLKLLELGTGSGCIVISLLLEMPNLVATASDISKDAIIITNKNAIKHGVIKRLTLTNSDWFNNLEHKKFDIIVSNPPYIADHEIHLMSPETIKYEPAIALFAENSGLAAYYIIAKSAKNFLNKEGKLFLEVGFNQASAVKEIFSHYNYTCKQVYHDLAGHERVLLFMDCRA